MPKQKSGLSLADIRNAKKTIAIDLQEIGFEGLDPLEVTFKTNFWTPIARQQYIDPAIPVDASNTELLVNSLLAWNLTDNGESVPICEESLKQISAAILDATVQAMLRAVRPNEPISQG